MLTQFHTEYDTNNPPPQPEGYTRFVLVSDTHGREPILPAADVLLHSGDFSTFTRKMESSLKWLASLRHEHKLIVRGNHDLNRERMVSDFFETDWAKEGRIHLLEHSRITIDVPGGDSWNIFGSPYWAPMGVAKGGEKEKRLIMSIPSETDILLTHGPPYGILDNVTKFGGIRPTGCAILSEEIAQRIRPRLHVFGHIHGGRGATCIDSILYVNAAISNGLGMNQPIIVDMKK